MYSGHTHTPPFLHFHIHIYWTIDVFQAPVKTLKEVFILFVNEAQIKSIWRQKKKEIRTVQRAYYWTVFPLFHQVKTNSFEGLNDPLCSSSTERIFGTSLIWSILALIETELNSTRVLSLGKWYDWARWLSFFSVSLQPSMLLLYAHFCSSHHFQITA